MTLVQILYKIVQNIGGNNTIRLELASLIFWANVTPYNEVVILNVNLAHHYLRKNKDRI